MRRKNKLCGTVIRLEERESDGAKYEYKLIMKESDSVASYGIRLYSIEIKMSMPDGATTYAEAKELFADCGIAMDFFDKLVDNLATPLNLSYVVEDELAR